MFDLMEMIFEKDRFNADTIQRKKNLTTKLRFSGQVPAEKFKCKKKSSV
ncbi:hypothetical protein ACFL20_04055 [Spirochaetota bacterium]